VTGEQESRIVIRRQVDGSFTVGGDQGAPAFTTFVTDGWQQIAQLRAELHATDHFPVSADYEAFCEEFGPPPDVSPA
jgi:hypothetical protein